MPATIAKAKNPMNPQSSRQNGRLQSVPIGLILLHFKGDVLTIRIDLMKFEGIHVAKQPLTKEQDQARLKDAASCTKCKQIWQTYSNSFCNAHSVSGWKAGLDNLKPSASASPKKTVTPRARVKQATRTVRAASSATTAQSETPLWKVALGMFVGLSILIGGCAALGSLLPDSWTEETTSTPTTVTKAAMPQIVGMPLSTARDTIDSLGVGALTTEVDVLSYRSVWDVDNWTVVAQSPNVGASLRKDQLICIGIVKNDETWRTTSPLQCWESAETELGVIGDNYELLLKDLIKVTNVPSSLNGKHLRAEVKIEMDGGSTVYLPYCTYAPVAGTTTNLKLDASNGGDPGIFANGGQSFEAGLFLDWSGRYRYLIASLEKSSTSKCTG